MKVTVEELDAKVNVVDEKITVNTTEEVVRIKITEETNKVEIKEETAHVVLDSHIHANKAILDAITGLPPQQLLLDEIIGCYFLIGG